MGVYAAAGAAYEPSARAGITALAARTASRATESRTALQIAEASELLGGSIGASVGSESFGWSFSVPTQNVERALELFADVVQHATLPDDAIETERVAMLADLAQLRDDMYRYPMRLVQEAAYDGHPYSIPAGGTDETLPALRGVDVRAWYRETMLHAPYVIAITGDVDADRVAGLVAARFGELAQRDRPALPRVEWPADGRVRGAEREKAQSALALAVPAPSRRDPERYAVRVLSSVASGLGGRFFEELRDKRSLAYTVHAFGAEHTRGGMFIAYIATSPEREQEARDGLLQQIADLRGTPVTDEELSRAKRYLLGMHDVRQERGGAVLGDMVDAWMFGTGLHEMDEFRDCIERVTANEILTLADRCFDPQSAVEGVVHGTAATARRS
jgi:zinc protease